MINHEFTDITPRKVLFPGENILLVHLSKNQYWSGPDYEFIYYLDDNRLEFLDSTLASDWSYLGYGKPAQLNIPEWEKDIANIEQKDVNFYLSRCPDCIVSSVFNADINQIIPKHPIDCQHIDREFVGELLAKPGIPNFPELYQIRMRDLPERDLDIFVAVIQDTVKHYKQLILDDVASLQANARKVALHRVGMYVKTTNQRIKEMLKNTTK